MGQEKTAAKATTKYCNEFGNNDVYSPVMSVGGL